MKKSTIYLGTALALGLTAPFATASAATAVGNITMQVVGTQGGTNDITSQITLPPQASETAREQVQAQMARREGRMEAGDRGESEGHASEVGKEARDQARETRKEAEEQARETRKEAEEQASETQQAAQEQTQETQQAVQEQMQESRQQAQDRSRD